MTGRTDAATAPRPVTPGGILAARLAEVCERVAASGGQDDALLAELRELRDLAAGLDPYVEAVTTPESPALAALARRTREHDWDALDGPLEQEMLSGHVEGQFLKTLVHATRARSILEVGLFTGYSALAMAEALPEDGRLVALELDSGVAALAQECFAASPAGARIEVRVGPAADGLADLVRAGERFDLVFVDADKGGYRAYLDALLDGDLLAENALVCVDNTLMQGEPWTRDGADASPNGAAIAAFNAAVAADPRVEQVLVPLRDGVTLIRRVA
ncbi:O-methyltransferase [Paraconexibacter algicola]|uniref:SAM-dependent methyltransferase n=1 Tax=Paraconexibacter algicola TaxID=2133960 RepID=A0A2T4UCU5_9ACTN|nr:class I SAM-dependent methyltransferase [Paraconexibacter algicola]PTL54991.1 SAM-dependent methyltransferase [Paraconexibacter algicola]